MKILEDSYLLYVFFAVVVIGLPIVTLALK